MIHKDITHKKYVSKLSFVSITSRAQATARRSPWLRSGWLVSTGACKVNARPRR